MLHLMPLYIYHPKERHRYAFATILLSREIEVWIFFKFGIIARLSNTLALETWRGYIYIYIYTYNYKGNIQVAILWREMEQCSRRGSRHNGDHNQRPDV